MIRPTSSLRLSERDRMLGGVCSGLAHWLGWDVMVVRMIFLLPALFWLGLPAVILFYIILYYIMLSD